MRFQLIVSMAVLLTGCDVTISQPSSIPVQEGPAPPPEDYPLPMPLPACDASAHSGISVEVQYALGAAREATLELIGTDGSRETLQSHDMAVHGLRMQTEKGLEYSYIQNFSGAYEHPGSFAVELHVNGKIQETKPLTIPFDGCHVQTQQLTFKVAATQAQSFDPTQEYYPLDGGSLAVRDPRSGSVKVVGSSKVWQQTEVVRLLMTETVWGDTVSIGEVQEKLVPQKTEIGRFQERGIDRGPVSSSNQKDLGSRLLFGI